MKTKWISSTFLPKPHVFSYVFLVCQNGLVLKKHANGWIPNNQSIHGGTKEFSVEPLVAPPWLLLWRCSF